MPNDGIKYFQLQTISHYIPLTTNFSLTFYLLSTCSPAEKYSEGVSMETYYQQQYILNKNKNQTFYLPPIGWTNNRQYSLPLKTTSA